MKIPNMLLATILVTGLTFFSNTAFSSGSKKMKDEESMLDKSVDVTKEAASDATRAVKKTARELDDKACEMVNGSLKCAGQKAEHAVENAKDKIKDATE